MGPAETDEIKGGEIVWNGNNEEGSGSRGRVWK